MKKLFAAVLCLAVVLSLVACGSETPAETVTPTETLVVDNGIDFEDGAFGFAAIYEGRADADPSTLEIADFGGSKALKIVNTKGKSPFLALDVVSLLGADASKVASVELDVGVEHPDGEFMAVSGQFYLWDGTKLSDGIADWSVYLESKNPKAATCPMNDFHFSEESPVLVIGMTEDLAAAAGMAHTSLYVDNIRFLDAEGNVLKANTAAEFTAPDGFAGTRDLSNLYYLAPDALVVEEMVGKSGAAWAQDGIDMTDEIKEALVPGAIVEIDFASTSGDIWLTIPDAEAGWSRIESQTAMTNLSRNICQITFEEIAAVLGDDVSKWGGRIQCESSGDWEVFGMKIGHDSGLVSTGAKTMWCENTLTGAVWAQDGFDLTEEMIAAMVPGTIFEIKYTSTSGDMWITMPDAEVGWSRIESQTAACDGNTCQITYEQMAAVLGEDTSKWGKRFQLESSGDWEVYSVGIANSYMVPVKAQTKLDGFAFSGDAWAQAGTDFTDDLKAKMVPGAVISIQYTCDTGDMWITMPDAEVGWSRIESQTAPCNGSVCQITYEQMAAVLGDDVSKWGGRIQFEASGAWEVYAVYIGTAVK